MINYLSKFNYLSIELIRSRIRSGQELGQVMWLCSYITATHVVRLSVSEMVDCDHISWKYWKLVYGQLDPTPSLFVAQRPSTNSQGDVGKFLGE